MFQVAKNKCKALGQSAVTCLWSWLDPSGDDEEKFDFVTN